MMRRVLEINDLELIAADRERVLLRSPGLVTCHPGAGPGGVLVGEAAARQARINPRATHDRFWSWLDAEPMARPAPPALSHADLAWLHLKDVVDEVGRHTPGWILAVPTEFGDAQLALLLGIARSLEISIDGLVSTPAAAAAAAGIRDDCVVIDAFRHYFVANHVIFASSQWHSGGSGAVEGRGLGMLIDAWARIVSDAFVAQTRLDPAHDATVEQALYDRLPEWLAQLCEHDSVEAVLPVSGQQYRAELQRAEFVRVAEPFVAALRGAIESAGDTDVVVRHRLKGLPGLDRLFTPDAPGRPVALDDHAVAIGILEREPMVANRDENGVLHVVRLPMDPAESVGSDDGPGSESESRQQILHVLVGDRAVPLPPATEPALELDGDNGARLSLEPSGAALLEADDSAAVEINGVPATGRAHLNAGDRLSVNGKSYRLLQVEPG